ncbi:hypothetical protein TGAM01_v207308 [Trichoderma gamsii]|uniref:Uncharacterized protein n=1 Tax=Trichoderma gamsii TaxID=398673 RepID=A0A2P4ZI54_9HYPO|nr:hypothetical protein TGAM01_v207308 [Trichoderma gamsii]PON23980.1 hypothetical protein TGAM01_v207308 [Trichoderma gamsii]
MSLIEVLFFLATLPSSAYLSSLGTFAVAITTVMAAPT